MSSSKNVSMQYEHVVVVSNIPACLCLGNHEPDAKRRHLWNDVSAVPAEFSVYHVSENRSHTVISCMLKIHVK